MPTVLRAHGLRFVILFDDHPPPHVHVSGRGAIRISIEPPHDVLTNKGMSRADIARARDAVKGGYQLFRDIWTQIHGPDD